MLKIHSFNPDIYSKGYIFLDILRLIIIVACIVLY